MKLEIGDIIGYKPLATKNCISFLVKIGAKQRHSHVMGYLGNNLVLESHPKAGVIIRHFKIDDVEDMSEFSVSRMKKPLNNEEQNQLVIRANDYLTEEIDYAFYQAFTLFLHQWFGGFRSVRRFLKWISKLDEKRFMNCSELMSRWYSDVLDKDLCIKHSHDFTKPDDVTYMKSKLLEEVT
jgi:hypothetical protein